MQQGHVTLIFACVVTLSSGTNYVVSAYLPQLGSRLHLSSLALNIVSGAGNAGVYLSGPLLGSFVDARGPKPVLSAAATCLLVGYAGLAIMYRGGEDGLYALVGVPGLALCQIATGVGGSAGLSASLKATSQSFPSSQRGAAMAAVLACFGLSAFFYSSIARAHLFAADGDPTPAFLFTLAVGCTISMVLGAMFVRPDPPASPYQLLEAEDDFAYTTPHFNGASPFPESGFTTPRERRILDDTQDVNESTYSLHPALEAAAHDDEGTLANQRPRGRRTRSSSPLLKDRGGQAWTQHHAGELDVNGWALLSERDFWTLFGFLGLCSGVGLMYINNLGTMVTTLASSEEDSVAVVKKQASLVSLLSLMNSSGRLAIGFTADFTTHHAPDRIRFARIWWLIATAGGFVVSQMLAGKAEHIDGIGGLAVPTMAVGFSYGTLFGLVPVLMLERFGIKDFAQNNGWLCLSPSIFANFSNLLFGAVYDSHVSAPESLPVDPAPAIVSDLTRRAGASTPAHLCTVGRECFATAFRATTVMSLIALGLAVSLSLRPTFKPAYR
ncbi:hypothetical protein JCM10908_001709 [Rhodotorula pacifica]|uniref:uncharacterized protein n=1 Tax=Rhodotorula pacifica TaxID=1495444 RepID=UPI003180C954